MDNDQKGQRKKQQMHGSGNDYVVVTHSMSLQPINNTTVEQPNSWVFKCKALIAYVNQAIISVHGMSKFEHINILDEVIAFLSNIDHVKIPLVPDYSGDRVNVYYEIVKNVMD